jgi:hypothetical protein
VIARPDATAPLLRRGLLWLGALTALGTTVELAVERHWTQPIMFLAWAAVAAVAAALAVLTGRPSAARVRLARILAAVVIAVAVVGVGEHVYGNFDAGALDRDYATSWDGLPLATRWWLAASKAVGPSPPLAPGALAQAAICALLATARHPALTSKDS